MCNARMDNVVWNYLGQVRQRGWLHGFTKGQIQLNSTWHSYDKLVHHMWNLCVEWGVPTSAGTSMFIMWKFFCTHTKFPPLQSNVHVMWDKMKCNFMWYLQSCSCFCGFVVLQGWPPLCGDPGQSATMEEELTTIRFTALGLNFNCWDLVVCSYLRSASLSQMALCS